MLTAIEFLNNLIELFKSSRNNIDIFEHLLEQGAIDSSFDKRFLLNNVDYDFQLIKTVYKNNDLIEFYLEAADGSPYKADLLFRDKWLLKSFLFQCQSCFGDDKDCLVCGGSGWGVL